MISITRKIFILFQFNQELGMFLFQYFRIEISYFIFSFLHLKKLPLFFDIKIFGYRINFIKTSEIFMKLKFVKKLFFKKI